MGEQYNGLRTCDGKGNWKDPQKMPHTGSRNGLATNWAYTINQQEPLCPHSWSSSTMPSVPCWPKANGTKKTLHGTLSMLLLSPLGGNGPQCLMMLRTQPTVILLKATPETELSSRRYGPSWL